MLNIGQTVFLGEQSFASISLGPGASVPFPNTDGVSAKPLNRSIITQIYEVQTPDEAINCISAGVDHIGSVLLSKDDWRQPAIREVARKTQEAQRKHSIIPLFDGIDLILSAMDYYRPDFVHFCDTPIDMMRRRLAFEHLVKLQRRVREEFPDIQIIRSIPVRTQGSKHALPTFQIAAIFKPVSDWFLIDTCVGDESPVGFIGITGRVADWGVSAEFISQCGIPVILAGGLSAENVYDAAVKVKPAGVDSCTHTNAIDANGFPVRFKKDIGKVARFVSEAKRAERSIYG